jgi:hypothetical protein
VAGALALRSSRVGHVRSMPIELTGLHPRIKSMLEELGSTLRIAVPSSEAATWDHYAYDELRTLL